MDYCYAASSGDLDPDLLGVECHDDLLLAFESVRFY
jgi:hypothetical protein